jgi:pyrroline-5-carboxylate reductase
MLFDAHVAFIGGGVMGEAIIKSLLRSGALAADHITLSEPNTDRRNLVSDKYHVHACADNADCARNADIVVLSVKPQVMGKVFDDLRGVIKPTALIFSIAAGISIDTMREGLGGHGPIVRVMPNTPAQIGQGISMWTCTNAVTDAQREQAVVILKAMGDEIYVAPEDEHYLDMTTALSGTGPGYVFMFMEALIDAGVHMGFSRQVAERLVIQTIKGSTEYAVVSKMHPAQLRNQVTSPGGTTAAAMYQLEKGGFRTVISKAVWAAYERSVELGKKK